MRVYTPVSAATGGGRLPMMLAWNWRMNKASRLLALPFRLAWAFIKWLAIGAAVAVLAIIGWLALTKPVERTLEPHGDPYVLVSQKGEPIARGGDVVLAPVEAELLPDHVVNAFIATEDRRF